MSNLKARHAYDPADLIFAPTLALTGFSEDLLLNYAMIAAYSSSTVYVGPFARSWHGLSITDLSHMPDALFFWYYIRCPLAGQVIFIFPCILDRARSNHRTALRPLQIHPRPRVYAAESLPAKHLHCH